MQLSLSLFDAHTGCDLQLLVFVSQLPSPELYLPLIHRIPGCLAIVPEVYQPNTKLCPQDVFY